MKRILLIVFVLTSSLGNYAQGNAERHQQRENRLKNLKIAFITDELNLSSEEAELFWPIYNEHQEQINGLRKNKIDIIRKERKNEKEDISEQEAKQILDNMLSIDEQMQKETKSMYTNLEQVLSAKKLLALHKAEHDFNRRVLKELQKERGKRPPQ